ncbi:MAG: glycine dehydrogenase (aminomethyl-transferring) [Elusimicrobia bacterium RIFCSPLOWO2_01_FULL_64_13]|nr:MAG: glycine dehydrogenase (aminomethyl-transferring) [Elusimicrobia bacterium RIFCSPLOWO2_01_FULL_64_13]
MPYVANTREEKEAILSAVGKKSFSELIANIPKKGLFFLPENSFLRGGLSEMEALSRLEKLSEKNRTVRQGPSFLGAGAYHHFIPAAVGALIGRGEFLTAYTPYQPEASQGTLQATFEFQTMIAELYGMDVANASLYDGASAMAEAALLAVRETGRKKILVSRAAHPEYRKVLGTICRNLEIREIPERNGVTDLDALGSALDGTAACVLVQHPNFFGCLEDVAAVSRAAHADGALAAVSTNPLSLGILEPPGAQGADIATGEGQPLGIPLGYGGPYLGLFACKERFLRKMPGRVAGMTVDADGKRGFTLTLQTREQHIRREKATSNICTNEALMALAATVTLSLLGPEGLKELAELNLRKAHYAAETLSAVPGLSLRFSSPFFNEFVVDSGTDPEKIRERLLEKGVAGGLPLKRFYPELGRSTLYCVTEMNSREDIDALAGLLGEAGSR